VRENVFPQKQGIFRLPKESWIDPWHFADKN
jgi:hypothetical protein